MFDWNTLETELDVGQEAILGLETTSENMILTTICALILNNNITIPQVKQRMIAMVQKDQIESHNLLAGKLDEDDNDK